MGIGFQLMDDYLDAFGTPELVGKQPGGDILSAKKTILIIKALETEKNQLLALLENKIISDQDKINKVKDIFIRTGAEKHLKQLSEKYFGLAFQNLKDLNVLESKKTDLNELLVYLQNRSY